MPSSYLAQSIGKDFLEFGFLALQQAVDPFHDPQLFTDGDVAGISLAVSVEIRVAFHISCSVIKSCLFVFLDAARFRIKSTGSNASGRR
jgi:hypothetical protein